MEAFFNSSLAVALAEIGDKTQLLSLFLAARFARKTPIVCGILVATLLNHTASAYVGQLLANWFTPEQIRVGVGVSFILVGLWLLIPDKDESPESTPSKWGPFAVTTALFFIAEIGDKTQLATVILAARYHALFWVTAGTTLGMMIANVPVVYLGNKFMKKLPLSFCRRLACGLFVILGIAALMQS